MTALNHDQFAEAINQHGGASRFAETQTDPGLTRGRYGVADPHNEQVVPLPVTREQVQQHHAQVLAHARGSRRVDLMQGGWPHAGQAYLDSSRPVVGRRAAVQLAKQNQQIAVFSHGRALDEKHPDVFMKRTEASKKARELEGETGVPHTTAGHSKVGWTVERRRA